MPRSGKKQNRWLWPPRSSSCWQSVKNVAIGLAEADDQVHADLPRPEHLPRGVEDLPVLRPAVRALHAATARALEDLRGAGVQGHGEGLGAERVQVLHVATDHRGRIGQDRDRDDFLRDARRPRPQHRLGVLVRARVRDHADAHAMEGRGPALLRDPLHHEVQRRRRPVHPDEIAISIVSLGLAMAGEAAIGAVRPAALGIGEQKIEAAGATAAEQAPRHEAERDGGGCRHLDVGGRTHRRGQPPRARQIDPKRRQSVLLDRSAVAPLGRHRCRRARRHVRRAAAAQFRQAGHRLANRPQIPASHGGGRRGRSDPAKSRAV